ncbi:hypothetical protein GWK47_029636 [Chionoecetes opilio]|uniref:Uncharacterized protein n=1 Tax=Chionoecetes opilio TaxID=41210 RepID=A0A8J4YK95_CHIOP|nr:hypothetical protein GWK47_029636 [Chionoecetes opilio]
MLLDIKFPECDFKDSLDATFDADKESSETDGETVSPGDRKSHQRRGTYDLEDGEETQETVTGKKRQRSSTFDLSESTDVARPIDEKQVHSEELEPPELADWSGNSARGAKDDQGPSRTQPASPWQANTSLSALPKRQRRSVTVTTSAPAPLLRPSTHQRRSRGTPAALTKPSATATATATATTTTTTKPVFTIGCGDEKMAVENTQPDKQGK